MHLNASTFKDLFVKRFYEGPSFVFKPVQYYKFATRDFRWNNLGNHIIDRPTIREL